MKNYLYILCAFLLAFAGCTKDADVEPIAPAPDGNTQVVLTGFSGRGTRTGFGGAEDGAVPRRHGRVGAFGARAKVPEPLGRLRERARPF